MMSPLFCPKIKKYAVFQLQVCEFITAGGLNLMKKICLLCIWLCVSLSACQGAVQEETVLGETEESVLQENQLPESEILFLERYQEVFVREKANRAALIYLDEDYIPELLILKNGEYRLYSFDGLEVKTVDMPDTEVKANAYGPRHDFEDSEHQTLYWFEYVPYKGLIRVHGGNEQERNDYYLRYIEDSFEMELATKSAEYTWHTYDGEKEISNEEFISQLAGLGYDELIPCSYLFDNVEAAYENIGTTPNTKKVLEDFVNGKIDALDYVEEISDIPEDGFVMRSYEDYYEYITAGEEHWGHQEYIDFDNDGEEELIMNGYCGSRYFFDVIGDTVYLCLKTGTTTDVSYVAEREGKRVIARTDLTHAGRKRYEIMTYDACCCLVDWFCLYTAYEGEKYSADDKFTYRNREISMEEYERIRDSIQ